MSFVIKNIRYKEDNIDNLANGFDIFPNVVATITYENNGSVKYFNGIDINGESKIFITSNDCYKDLEKKLNDKKFDLVSIDNLSDIEMDFHTCEDVISLLHESTTEYDSILNIMLFTLRTQTKDLLSKINKDNVLESCIDKLDNEIKLNNLYEENNQIIEKILPDVYEVIESLSDFSISKNDLKKNDIIKDYIKNNSFAKRIVDAVYDDYFVAKLNYSKNYKTIKKTTKIFEKLVEDNELAISKIHPELPNIVELTYDNANKIYNALISDDSYVPFSQYMYEYFKLKGTDITKDYKALFIIVREIDRDNSTNAWRYKKNRDSFREMIKYMVDSKNEFFEKLDNCDPKLPDYLEGNKSCIRSLSSKVCNELNCYIKGLSDRDYNDYYKNDKFVRHVLPFYLDYYGIKHNIKTSSSVDNEEKFRYYDIHILLDKLKDKANEVHNNKPKLTRNDIDRILWYCYKSFKDS